MLQKIKHWLGFKDHYFVSYNLGADKIEENKHLNIQGFGNIEIISDEPLSYDSVNKMANLIKEKAAKEFPYMKNWKIVIINIIKLER